MYKHLIQNRFLLISLILFIILYLFFFPVFYASIDEHQSMKNTFNIASLNFFEKDRSLSCGSLYSESGYVARAFPGRSFFMVPFSFFGFGGIMISGLFIHLINFFLLWAVFRKLKIDARFLILYLFFPAFLWSSRTLYPGLLVLTFLLAGFYFYISEDRKSLFLSGFSFGLAFLIRYDAFLAFLAFLIPLAIKKRKEAAYFALGAIPAGLFFLAHNFLLFGDPFRSAYGSTYRQAFMSVGGNMIGALIPDMPIFIIILFLIYPFLLGSALLKQKYRPEFILLSLAYVFISAKFTIFLAYEFSISTLLTARLRYLIPLIGILLIPYSSFLQSKMESFKLMKAESMKKGVFGLMLVVLFIGSAFGMYSHQQLLQNRADTFSQIYSNTPADSLIVGTSEECIYFENRAFPERRFLKLNEYLEGEFVAEETYIVFLEYGYRSSRESERQKELNRALKPMSDFIEENKEDLNLVFESREPNFLQIYKLEKTAD